MRRKRSDSLGGWIKGGVGAIVVAGIAAAWSYSQPLPRDEQTLCLKTAGAELKSAHSIVVVDKTDKWSPAQGSRLRHLILSVRDQLAVNARLSIFVFSDHMERGFGPVFSLCNPGRATDTNFWISNPRRWERRFVESFGKPLDQILDDLSAATEGPVSPILEILVDLTNREELLTGGVPRQIIIVSDMLENSDAYSFFPRRMRLPLQNTHPSTNVPTGGPYVPLQIVPNQTGSASPKPIVSRGFPNVNKLTPTYLEAMVQKKGGLRNLVKFQLEVYQIHGVYPETKLESARKFWDLIAAQYGVRVVWKVL